MENIQIAGNRGVSVLLHVVTHVCRLTGGRTNLSLACNALTPRQPADLMQATFNWLKKLLVLCVFALHQCLAMPLGSQCMDESFCTSNLQNHYNHLIDLSQRINERSIAAWTYVENIDLNRIPQVIYQANCHTSHSCQGVESLSSLETIPISLRIPVLKKNPLCEPTSTYSLEQESVNIACICAVSRRS